MTLPFLKSIGQLFCQMSLRLGVSGLFSWLDWGNYFWKEFHRNYVVFFLMHHIMGFMMSKCFIIGNVDLDHLVKTVSAGFLHLTVTIFSLAVNKYRGGNALRWCKSCFSSTFTHCFLAYVSESQFCSGCYYGICLTVIFCSSLSSTFINWNSIARKSPLSLPSI